MKKALFMVLALIGLAIPAAGGEEKPLPPFIHNSGLIVHPERTAILYASFWLYGIYKSEDYGRTWRQINQGLKNTSVYTLKMSPTEPETLMAGTHAGGVYKTADGGQTWVEANTGLTNTTIWDLAIDPREGEHVYALTSAGLFESTDGGGAWKLLPGDIPGRGPDQQMTLFMLPSRRGEPSVLLLQNGGQLFRRLHAGQAGGGRQAHWSPGLLEEMTSIRSTPLAYDAATGRLYAGSRKGLLRSRDGGSNWKPLTTEIRNATWMVLAPGQRDVLYIGTDGKGVFRSTDGGVTVRPVNDGLEGPTSLKIFGLAIDPKDGKRLYAASHSIGLFRTEDGGAHWIRPEAFPVPSVQEMAAFTKNAVMASGRKGTIGPPPDDFVLHCNKCHGWTDPVLDRNPAAVWRAAPTPRNWTQTVDRMTRLAGLEAERGVPITGYLNRYFGVEPSDRPMQPAPGSD